MSEAWRNRIAEWIVVHGCLYVVAWGVDCEVWHDSVDWTVLEKFDFGEVPNEHFVMTTFHNNEPLSEAFWWSGQCATHPDVELNETFILHVGLNADQVGMLKAFRESQSSE